MRETNIHHHFYTRAEWTKRKVDKLIREHPLSKSAMHIPEHVELHRHLEPVKPPLTRAMSERVLFLIRSMPERYTPLDAAKSLRDEGIETISEHLDRQIEFLELSKIALSKRVV